MSEGVVVMKSVVVAVRNCTCRLRINCEQTVMTVYSIAWVFGPVSADFDIKSFSASIRFTSAMTKASSAAPVTVAELAACLSLRFIAFAACPSIATCFADVRRLAPSDSSALPAPAMSVAFA